jgi:hypothetical protein
VCIPVSIALENVCGNERYARICKTAYREKVFDHSAWHFAALIGCAAAGLLQARRIEAAVNPSGENDMKKALLIVATGFALAGCQSERQTAGTATGVAAGALVGGAVGATATRPGGALGGCQAVDARGNPVFDRQGRPLMTRCR